MLVMFSRWEDVPFLSFTSTIHTNSVSEITVRASHFPKKKAWGPPFRWFIIEVLVVILGVLGS